MSAPLLLLGADQWDPSLLVQGHLALVICHDFSERAVTLNTQSLLHLQVLTLVARVNHH